MRPRGGRPRRSQEARSRDPIARLGAVLAERGVGPTELGKIIDEAKAEMAAARKDANAAPWPEAARRVRGRAGYGGGGVVEVTLIEASRRAALQEMRRDERVWVLGEDVARGGLWGQYKDFLGEFGEQRVVSTPISESTIMGAGLGSALVGMRPIIEMRIFDFVMCAMDELVNQIAKIRYMFGGQAKPAVVVRMPHGMWRNSAAQHSQMLEAWFAHLPGVVVVTPSTAEDTAGLLVQAIRSDDPVLFFDPKDLFGVPGNIADPIEPIPFGVARQVVEGDAATVVSWSAAMPVATKGVAMLASDRHPGRSARPAHDLAVGSGRGDRVGEEDRAAAGGARGGGGRGLRRRDRRDGGGQARTVRISRPPSASPRRASRSRSRRRWRPRCA